MAKMLRERPGAPIRAFVIWEPVIWSDAFRPSDRALAAKAPDPRAAHYWDPGKSLSREILRSPWTEKYAVRGGPMGIVWDWVACYPPGARWESHFPEPLLQSFPVIDGQERVRDWIGRTAPRRRI